MPRIIKISKLRPGDRFSSIPADWHGPGVVMESCGNGSIWCVKFDNPKVVNPLGIIYAEKEGSTRMKRMLRRIGLAFNKEQRVRLLGRKWRGEKGYRTY